MYDPENQYEEVLPQLLDFKKSNPQKSNRVYQEETLPKKEEQKKSTIIQSPHLQSVQRKASLDNATGKKEKGASDPRKQKQLELSRNLVNELMKKISQKSVSEQNYPVSNETVERLMIDLDDEYLFLKQQKNKYQSSLLMNPSNQHIKNELQAVEKSINKIQTIKDLYIEKIESRNKISYLEEKIMNLKSENKELKIKIERGIQKIQSHIHNLPCEKEKQLIEEVNKYKELLNRERDMRENLQMKIQAINLNFSRLYQQAETARKIVRNQLKDIQKKEQELVYKAEHQKRNYHKGSQLSDKNNNFAMGQSMKQNFQRELTPTRYQEENIAGTINQVNRKQNLEKSNSNINRKRNATINSYDEAVQGKRPRTYTNRFEGDDLKNPVKDTKESGVFGQTSRVEGRQTKRQYKGFNMRDQIEKMRMNQVQFSKISNRKI